GAARSRRPRTDARRSTLRRATRACLACYLSAAPPGRRTVSLTGPEAPSCRSGEAFTNPLSRDAVAAQRLWLPTSRVVIGGVASPTGHQRPSLDFHGPVIP